jgi:hypothetical protein
MGAMITVTGARRPPVSLPVALWAAPAGLLLIALMRLPYGYYTFLRLAVCAAAAVCAWQILRASRSHVSGWVMVAMALLYNPLLIVRLSRATWGPVNVTTAAIFAGVGLFLVWQARKAAASTIG